MAKGRREGQTQSPNSRPDATAGFPQRRFTAKEAETPAGAGREGRGIAAPNAPSGQPDPTKAGEHGLHAPSPPRPESRTRETPFLSRTPRGPKAMQPKAPPTWRGGAGPQPRVFSASPSRPFLHHRTRAGPASDRRDEGPPLRAHRDYALLPLPHGVRPRSAPHSHAREAEAAILLEEEKHLVTPHWTVPHIPPHYRPSHRPNKSAPASAGHRIGRLPLVLSQPQEAIWTIQQLLSAADSQIKAWSSKLIHRPRDCKPVARDGCIL
ncbi:proline-rich protein 2-like [Peromyscus eremicus]|uniref:proline-rich protein 2-like n=1 Tax=Peromyscus eremicus TaxID=42410 RepID=UPI0027DD0D1D|nr:proline-rich protein 2-like [Peromyscus eremicus]